MPHTGSGGFQVAPLSPAALLNNRQERNPLDQIFGQALNFAFQQRLLESSQAQSVEAARIAAAGNLERDLADRISTGAVQPNQEFFPGQNINTFEGPTGTPFAGQEFVSTSVLNTARQAREDIQPVEFLFGRETFPGVLRGDINDPSQSDLELQGLVRGDVERIQQQINVTNDKKLRDALQVTLDEAKESGLGFTALEENTLSRTAQEIQVQNDAWANTLKLAKEDRAKIGQTTVNIMTGAEFRDPLTGAFRDLTHAEASLMAKPLNGIVPTPEEEAEIVRLEENSQPRRTLINVSQQIQATIAGAGGTDATTMSAFITWIMPQITEGEGGSITNQAVLEDILGVGATDVDRDRLQVWAAGGGSLPYRMAFALQLWVGSTRGQVEDKLDRGLDLGFNEKVAYRVLELLDPDGFNDVPGARNVNNSPEDAAASSRQDLIATMEGGSEAQVQAFRDLSQAAIDTDAGLEFFKTSLQTAVDQLSAGQQPENAVPYQALLDLAVANPEEFFRRLREDIVVADSLLAR